MKNGTTSEEHTRPKVKRRDSQRSRKIHKLLYKRTVRKVLYALRNFSLPGCQQVSVYELLRLFIQGMSNNMLWQRAKGTAYSFLVALPPLLVFFFSLIAFFPVDGLQDELLSQLQSTLPASMYEYLSKTVNDIMGHRHKNLMSIGFIASVVMAVFAMNGLMMSFSFANQNIDHRPLFRRLLVCLLLVVVLYVVVTLVLALFMGYKWMIQYLTTHGLLEENGFNLILVGVGRWLLMVMSIFFLVSIIYYLAPVKSQRVGFAAIGSWVSTLMFFLFSWGFKIYIRYFNRYNLIYGSIGTILLIMLWIFFNCLVLLIGYEMNIAVANGKKRRSRSSLDIRRLGVEPLSETSTDEQTVQREVHKDASLAGNTEQTGSRCTHDVPPVEERHEELRVSTMPSAGDE